MKLTQKLFSAALAVTSLASPAWAKKHTPNMLKACKVECPDAKTNKDVHACAEALESGADAAKFKKSKCYRAHEKYEAATGQTEAGEREHEESKK